MLSNLFTTQSIKMTSKYFLEVFVGSEISTVRRIFKSPPKSSPRLIHVDSSGFFPRFTRSIFQMLLWLFNPEFILSSVEGAHNREILINIHVCININFDCLREWKGPIWLRSNYRQSFVGFTATVVSTNIINSPRCWCRFTTSFFCEARVKRVEIKERTS